MRELSRRIMDAQYLDTVMQRNELENLTDDQFTQSFKINDTSLLSNPNLNNDTDGVSISSSIQTGDRDMISLTPSMRDARELLSWQRYMSIPTRGSQTQCPCMYVFSGRSTCADVMSVTNTTRVLVSEGPKSRKHQCQLPYDASSDHWLRVGADLKSSDNTNNSALFQQHEKDARAKLNKTLMKERKIFMERLHKERRERQELESWAATRLQSICRGYLVRPKPEKESYRRKSAPPLINLTLLDKNRKLVADLQQILSSAGLPLVKGVGIDGWPNGSSVIERTMKRQRSKRQRAVDEAAVIILQRVARGFMGRRYFRRIAETVLQGKKLVAVIHIQRNYRGYCCRKLMDTRGARKRAAAAVKIQALWRGVATRQHLKQRKKHEAVMKRRINATACIAGAARRRLARKRVKRIRELKAQGNTPTTTQNAISTETSTADIGGDSVTPSTMKTNNSTGKLTTQHTPGDESEVSRFVRDGSNVRTSMDTRDTRSYTNSNPENSESRSSGQAALPDGSEEIERVSESVYLQTGSIVPAIEAVQSEKVHGDSFSAEKSDNELLHESFHREALVSNDVVTHVIDSTTAEHVDVGTLHSEKLVGESFQDEKSQPVVPSQEESLGTETLQNGHSEENSSSFSPSKDEEKSNFLRQKDEEKPNFLDISLQKSEEKSNTSSPRDENSNCLSLRDEKSNSSLQKAEERSNASSPRDGSLSPQGQQRLDQQAELLELSLSQSHDVNLQQPSVNLHEQEGAQLEVEDQGYEESFEEG